MESGTGSGPAHFIWGTKELATQEHVGIFQKPHNSSTGPLVLQRRRGSYCSPAKDAAYAPLHLPKAQNACSEQGSIQGTGASVPDRDTGSECTEYGASPAQPSETRAAQR